MPDQDVERLLDEYLYQSILLEAMQLIREGYPLSQELKDKLLSYDINPKDLEELIW